MKAFNIFMLLFLSMASGHAVADTKQLEQLKYISNAGAPFLTLAMLDQAQPSLDDDLYSWILWEQERFKILTQWQQWDDLLIRIESLPDDLPEQFKYQVLTQQAKAYLQLQQTDTVRKILRPYLWTTMVGKSKEYNRWRKIIVDSYISDGLFDDARIAMRRYEQDFNSQDTSWLENRAMILIQSGHLDEAEDILKRHDDVGLQGLHLYVEFLSKKKSSRSVWAEASQHAKKYDANSKAYAMYWMIALSATAEMSAVDRVNAYEKVLQTSYRKINDVLLVDVDRLWTSYLEYAEVVGNRSELLQGDDESWLSLGLKAIKLTPVKARSLFSYLMLTSKDKQVIESAAKAYLTTLDLESQAAEHLLSALFRAQGQFNQVADIPDSIRFELVDLALKKANISEATRLMSGLEQHPKNSDLFAWQLRRARVLILGGQVLEGHSVMEQLLLSYSETSAEKTDKILQILFDLQTIGAHDEALLSFKQLLNAGIELKQQREILFWMADSYKALDHHQKAALLYLQSALFAGEKAMDPWAQTARFAAAESLQQAGLMGDSKRIFEGLLEVTDNATRRAALRHKIQQLWLTENAH